MSVDPARSADRAPVLRDPEPRRLSFRFEDDIPFDWNAGNAAVGNAANYAAIIAPAFERYFLRITREALRRIDDDGVRRNAELFCAQEGLHSRQHRAHLEVLLRRYPGLQRAVDAVDASYERLHATHDLAFHLAYMAILEGWFGPLALFFVENREALFGRSDARMASFVLWHLVEEFEHRSSAHAVYHALVPSHWPLVRHIPEVVAHIAEQRRHCLDAFLEHVPEADNPSRGSVVGLLDGVPWHSTLRFLGRLVAAILPGHDPGGLAEPAWITQWFRDAEAGVDMTLYYPARYQR